MTADVVVIGGGLAGLTVAAELAREGARVTVLEKDDVGFEQSSRSAAGVGLPAAGAAPPGAGAALPELAAHAWDDFETRWDCSVELNRDGWVAVAVDEQDLAFLERDMARWEGHPHTYYATAQEARARFLTLTGDFLAADVRAGGHVNPLLAIRALHEAGLRTGVDYWRGVTATGFETSGERVTAVRTSAGPVPCGTVVVAAGMWSSLLCDQLGVHVPHQRVRLAIGVTGPLPRDLVPGFLRAGTFGARQNADGTVRIVGGYRKTWTIHDLSLDDLTDAGLWARGLLAHRGELALRADPRVLWRDVAVRVRRGGGRFPTGWEPSVDKRSLRRRLELLGALIPAFQGVRIQRWSAGVCELTPDFEPVLGPLPTHANVHVASGFSGHGFILGPGAGRAVAAGILGSEEQIDLGAYRPDRFMAGDARVRSDSMF